MHSTNKKVFVIAGPTASGKTSTALHIASKMDVEIISADSRQVYKYLDIGTAKASKEEMSVCQHHLIDFLLPSDYYSAGKFGDDASAIVDSMHARSKIPLIVGGSGLYIKSLCDGFFEDDGDNQIAESIRRKLENELLEIGKEAMYQKLEKVDFISAQKYIDRNPRRVIRALTYFELNGVALSESQQNISNNKDYDCTYFGLYFERQSLYKRINERTIQMWEQGLADETQKVLDMGYSPNINAINTVGYKETIQFLNDEISEEECIALIQQNTRRYAKRQMTWFRNQYSNMKWVDASSPNAAEEIASNINQILTDT